MIETEDDWTECDDEALQRFMTEVKSDEFPSLFSGPHFKLYKKPLSFYDGYEFYALSNQCMIPFYEMYFLSNGENHQYLDGTIFPFQALINLEAMSLTLDNVEDYLEFYFRFVFYPNRKILYIKDPNDSPYLGASAMRHHFKTLQYDAQRQIEHDSESQAFHLTAPVLHNGKTVQGHITVYESGIIEVLDPEHFTLLDNSIDDAAPSYIHPHEKEVLENNKEILTLSEEGNRLLSLLSEYGIKLRIVAGIPHCGFAISAKEAFIIVPAYQVEGNGYQAIDMATALREAEHYIIKEPRPDAKEDDVTFLHGNLEANLDVIVKLCIIAEECEKQGNSEVLNRLRRMGYERIYSGHKDGESFEALFEHYKDFYYGMIESE